MVFSGTKAFFTRPLKIDYQRKEIEIFGHTNFLFWICDFFGNILINCIAYTFYCIPIILLFPESNKVLAPVFLIFFTIHNILYVLIDAKWIKKLQLLIEFPVHGWLWNHKYKYDLKNCNELEIRMRDYYNLKLFFSKEIKPYVKFIEYEMYGFLRMKRRLIITFTKNVTGSLVKKTKGGKDLKVIQYEEINA